MISKYNFIQLLKLATKEVEFSFNGIMYCQTNGITMGSFLGSTLVDIFMGYLEYIIIPYF